VSHVLFNAVFYIKEVNFSFIPKNIYKDNLINNIRGRGAVAVIAQLVRAFDC